MTLIPTLPDNHFQCVVTSPPYFGLRDYNHDEQIGREESPDQFVNNLVNVFEVARPKLKSNGTLWVNLGDSYWGGKNSTGLKKGDLVGTPWMFAFAMRTKGWYLRQTIIWHKPNPMPESVKNRCTTAHEYVFLFSKQSDYYFDSNAIAEPADPSKWGLRKDGTYGGGDAKDYESAGVQKPRSVKERLAAKLASGEPITRNAHSVWSISKQPFKGAHFAVMPTKLAAQCIKAGSAEGDWVLDPFGGAGTTAVVSQSLKRNWIITELNPEFATVAQNRIAQKSADSTQQEPDSATMQNFLEF
jgi:DNA modification methylase